MPCPKVGLKLATASPNGTMPPGEAVQLVVAAPPAGRERVEGRLAERLRLRQRGGEMRRQQLGGQRQHLRERPRRFGIGHPEGGEHPGAVLVAQHAQPQRLLVGGPGDDHLLGDQAVGYAELPGGVVDADVQGLFGRARVAPPGQPHRQPGAAAGRVDDQAGRHELGADGVAGIQQHPGDPPPGGVEARLGDAAPHDLDVGAVAHAPAQLPFQVRAAGNVGGELVAQGLPHAEHVARGAEMDAVGPVLQHGHARGDHVPQQSGEQAVELDRPAGHQHVQVPVLGHRRAVGRGVRQLVAFVDGHPRVELREDPRGAQPRDAGPDDDGVFPCVVFAPGHFRRVPSTVPSNG